MDFNFGADIPFERGSWLAMMRDIATGVIVGVTRYYYYVLPTDLDLLFVRPVGRRLFGMKFGRDYLRSIGALPSNKTIEVAGVGYGRTGTMTLYMALEELGFKTYHSMRMPELGDILSTQNEDLFMPSIRSKKLQMNKLDFDFIASQGFNAVCDLPMAFYYEQLMEEYPNCKFILTTRKTSEVWFKSWDRLMKSLTNRLNEGGYFWWSYRMIANYYRYLYTILLKDESYLSRPFPFPNMDKDKAIASYEEHNARVREIIPQEKLLEFQVDAGWAPLCEFLEIQNCPAGNFPRSNSSLNLTVFAIAMNVSTTIFTAGYLLLTVVVIYRYVIRPFIPSTRNTKKENKEKKDS